VLTIFYAAQIAKYMKDAKLKFGFLTSYEQTVFLKMAMKPGSSSWMILCSPVIYHNVETNRKDQEVHCDPSSSAYSLRECFFALMFHCLYNPIGDEVEDGNDDEFIVPMGRFLAKSTLEKPAHGTNTTVTSIKSVRTIIS
jgi:hypothetical protein